MAIVKVTVLIFFIFISRSTTELNEADNKSPRSADLSRKLQTFRLAPKHKVSFENAKNFVRLLDTLLNHSDFQPLVTSIGHYRSSLISEFSDIHDIATKYFQERSLDHYQYDLKTGSDDCHVLPIGITWIILIDDRQDFSSIIRKMNYFLESSNRFLIISLDERQESAADWANFLLHFLWNEKRIVKATITLFNEEFRYVYRYAPFAKIGKDYGRVDRLDLVENGSEYPLNVKTSFFEDFRNLNGYPIHVTIFPSLMMKIYQDKNNRTSEKRLDAYVMKLIEKRTRANFRVNVHRVNRSADPFESALRQLEADGKTEFVFTGYFKTFYNGTYSFTTSIFQDRLCLVAPSSKALPKFFMPLLPFNRRLWLLLLAYNFLVVLLWLSLRRFEAAVERQIDRTRAILTIELSIKTNRDIKRKNCRSPKRANYRSSTSGPPSMKINGNRVAIFREPPRLHRALIGFFDFFILACSSLQGGKTNAERAFLFGTLFFGLIVVGLYNSNLVSSLSKPIYYPQLQTLRDVANSNFTIFTKYENLMRNVPTDGSPEVEKWRSKIRVLNSTERTNDIVAYRGMIALSRSSSFKLDNLTRYYDAANNRLSLHCVKECPATYYTAYVVKKNSPYLERIDELLLRIRQSGLITKCYEHMLQTAKRIAYRNKSRLRGKRAKLELAHLSLAFIGLAVGLFLSALICLGEIYFATKFRLATGRIATRRT